MLVALIASLLPLAAQEVAPDHTGLLPASSAVVLRLESLDAFHGSMSRLMGRFGSADALPAKEELLGELFMLPVGSDGVDPARPIYLGLDVSFGAPLVTAVLPALDAGAIAAAAGEAGAKSAEHGEWVAVSTKPDYAPGEANPVLAGMQPGVASLHVDLESLLETYGGLVEMVLARAEAGMAEAPVAGGMDMQAVAELYLDGVRTFLDSAESLDLALFEDDHELSLGMRYVALEDSDLDGLFSPLPLPETLPVAVDPAAQLAFVVSGDMAELVDCVDPWVEQLLYIYPESLRGGMADYFRELKAVYGMLGNTAVATGGFEEHGMNMAFFGTRAEGAELAAGVLAALRASTTSLGTLGFGFGQPRELGVEGVEGWQVDLSVDYDAFAAQMASATPEDADPADVERALTAGREMMQAIYGPDPVVSLAQAGERVCMTFGSGEAIVSESVARLSEESVSASPLLADLRGLPPVANPLVLYRIDIGDMMKRMAPVLAQVAGEEEGPFPDAPLGTTFWMAVNERSYHGGVTVDPVELAEFVEAGKSR